MVDSDSIHDFLKPSELATFLGLQSRMTRKILGELEALGFTLPVGQQGTRMCPPGLAAAVKTARDQGKELASLLLDPALTPFLARDARGVEPDPLDVLVFATAEIGIVREAVAVMASALNVPSVRSAMRPFSWTNASLPDPRNGL